MSAVLGLSGGYHDAAAALFVDGALVAAIHEERLSRVKHDPGLPLRAARACLDLAGLQAADLARVTFYEDPYAKLERVLVHGLRGLPGGWRSLARSLEVQLGQKLFVLDRIAGALGVDRRRVGFVRHHESHAASAFFASPFERAAVLTIDGVGEWTTTALWVGDGERLTERSHLELPHSLGLLYAGITAWLGFPVNGGEHRVMGLAAHGRPSRRAALDPLATLHRDGSFTIDAAAFDHFRDLTRGYGPGVEALLGPARPPGRPWDLSDPADRDRADVAASVQQLTEDAVLGLAHAAHAATGCEALCLAGGVALNCVAVARLVEEGPFREVFVQPAAGDAGGAWGAGALAAIEAGDGRPAPLTHARWGRPIDPARAAALARALGLPTRRVADPAQEAARRLSQGQVVALCAGRSEWGPRALGQRSLLAPATDPAMPDHLNRVVKLREPFRPFAPAVLASHAADHFEGVPDRLTPFMTTTRRVRDPAALPAITHIDGTARVQTVTAQAAPTLHATLSALHHAGGPPLALLTSLNGPGEPIVDSAADALAFLVERPVPALLVGDLLITRPRGGPP
jgi:carbamoyltransferase